MTNYRRILGLCVIACLWVLSETAWSELTAKEKQTIDAVVQAEMQRQEAVGVAIGIIQNGNVTYTAGYGWSDRENKIPVSNETLFRWASISKPLTAVAAMQLAEQDKLELDEDVRVSVPEFPDKGTPITMRQLLGHLGGIVHYSNGPVIKTNRTYDVPHPHQNVILALDRFKESPLVEEPGSKFAYTTHGYILASAVIQRCGDDPYAQQVQERIATPLNLTTLRPDYQWEEISGRAKGYRKRDGQVIPSTNTDVSWKLGGGGWISNVDDLAGFASGLMGDELISDESKQIMWVEQSTINGNGTGYGLGFGVSHQDEPSGQMGSQSNEDKLKIAHSGAQEKTRTLMVIYPGQRHGIVVMTNSEYANPRKFIAAIDQAIKDPMKIAE